jgi:hypothetical protein
MILEIDFVCEHLNSIERDFKELMVMISERYDIEGDYSEKLKKVYDRNFTFQTEKLDLIL